MALTSGEYYNKKTGASYRVGWYINKEGKRVYCIGVKRKDSDNYRRWRSRSNMDFKEYNKIKAVQWLDENKSRFGNMSDVGHRSVENFVEIKG